MNKNIFKKLLFILMIICTSLEAMDFGLEASTGPLDELSLPKEPQVEQPGAGCAEFVFEDYVGCPDEVAMASVPVEADYAPTLDVTSSDSEAETKRKSSRGKSLHKKFKKEPIIKKYMCDRCDAGFSKREHFDRHFNAVHLKLRPYVCAACGNAFAQEQNFKRHLCQSQMPSQEQCAMCGTAFANEEDLNLHDCGKISISKPICKVCLGEFDSPKFLRLHTIRMHPKLGIVTKNRCSECKKYFATKYELERHRPIHAQVEI